MGDVETRRARLGEIVGAAMELTWVARGADAVRPLLAPRIRRVYFDGSGPWPYGADVDHVHDVRVATRRLRAALAVAAPLMEAGAADEARDMVRTLGLTLGSRRTADVHAEWVGAALAHTEDAAERSVLLRLQALCELRKRRATARILAQHPASTLVDDGLRILRWAEEAPPDGPTLSEGIDAELRKRASAFARQIEAMERPQDDEGHHRLRILLKRLRYTCEIAVESWPGRVPPEALPALRAMQTALGELHDRVELIALVDAPRARRGVPAVGVDAIVARVFEERAQAYATARGAIAEHGAALVSELRI